jgi:DNA-binding PadR family transcriptional regulator
MEIFLEDKLTEAGVVCPCKVRLGRAVHASGGTQGDFHAVKVEHSGVIVVAQCGNNETRRRLHLTCQGIASEEVFEKIEAAFGKPVNAGSDDNEGAGDNPPTTPWFLTDETTLGCYLIELEPLLNQPKGALYGDAIQAVRRVTPKQGRDRSKTYDQILEFLVDQALLLDYAESGAGKGWRRFYHLTEKGNEMLATAKVAKIPESTSATSTPPTTKLAPNPSARPSLLSRARQMADEKLQEAEERMREAEEIERLIVEVEPINETMSQLRDLKRNTAKIEEQLVAKYGEIEKLEATLTPEMSARYERLKELLPNDDS